MRLRNVIGIAVLWAAFCLLYGCTAREPLPALSTDSGAEPISLSFETQVATLPEGSTRTFAESPFGPVTIVAGPFYLSGLGNECRLVHIKHGNILNRQALCKENGGQWHFIPNIFEEVSQ